MNITKIINTYPSNIPVGQHAKKLQTVPSFFRYTMNFTVSLRNKGVQITANQMKSLIKISICAVGILFVYRLFHKPSKEVTHKEVKKDLPPTSTKPQTSSTGAVINYTALSKGDTCLDLQGNKEKISASYSFRIPNIDNYSPGLRLAQESDFTQLFPIAILYSYDVPYHEDRLKYIKIEGITIYRPDHNNTSAQRQMRIMEALLDLHEKRQPSLFSDQEKLNLKLGMYFLRVGRIHESAWWTDNFSSRSASIYEAYAKQLGIEEKEIAWMKEQIIHSCKHEKDLPTDFRSDEKKITAHRIIAISHDLDMKRFPNEVPYFSPGRDRFQKLCELLEKLIPESNSQAYAEKLIQFYDFLIEKVPAYHTWGSSVEKKALFKQCSQDGVFCWEQLRQVPLPDWT